MLFIFFSSNVCIVLPLYAMRCFHHLCGSALSIEFLRSLFIARRAAPWQHGTHRLQQGPVHFSRKWKLVHLQSNIGR